MFNCKSTICDNGAIFVIALLVMTVHFGISSSLYVEATVKAAKESSVQNPDTVHFAGNRVDRSLPQKRPHVTHTKKLPCHGRMCELDLSTIDLSAEELFFEVGPTGITTIDPSAIEVAAATGLNVTLIRSFRRSDKGMIRGHWSGESGFSYLNLLKQGTGPSGNNLWFGTMYDSENDMYYSISPDATGNSIVANATRGSERPLPTGIKVPVSKVTSTFSNMSTIVAFPHGHRKLVDDGSIIDIMFVWTLGAECKVSSLDFDCTVTPQTETNMRGKIDVTIAGINQVYANSGILTQLRLVHAYRHPSYKWDTQNNCGDALGHLTETSDGQLDDVHSYRSKYRADMVQMISAPCGYCGVAWVGAYKSYAFSVVTSNCLDVFVSAHELGHNMGCNHDRAADDKCSDPGYNFGYKNPYQRFTDIMSYDCTACKCDYNCGKENCATAARISNTNFLYNGFPIGDAQNNCARTIHDHKSTIASYFDSTSPTASCSNIEENVDYIGNDIGSALSATAQECCGICNDFSGCKAFAWSNYNGGTCWLKSGKGSTITKSGVSSAVLAYSSCSYIEENVDYSGNLIGSSLSPTAEGCCSICLNFYACKAFVWSNTNGGTCWLKSEKGVASPASGLRSAVLVSSICTPIEENTDYSGNDIGSALSTAAEGCCNICRTYSGCKAYAWSNYSGGTCWLKSGKGSTITKSGVRSAVLGSSYCATLVSNKGYYGNDIGTGASTSPEGCCLICQSTPGCMVFTWIKSTNTCWLKSVASNAVTNSDFTSGTIWLTPVSPVQPRPAPTKPHLAPTKPTSVIKPLPVAKPAPVPKPLVMPVPKPAPIKPAKPAPIKPTKPAPIKPTKPAPTKPAKPASKPTKPTLAPVKKPSRKPSGKPSAEPTEVPTEAPSVVPSAQPTLLCNGSFALQNNSTSIAFSVIVQGNVIGLYPGDKIELDRICVSDTLVLEDIPVSDAVKPYPLI